ncbi:glycine cleavage system protein GcvH [Alicyclobacillus contaminans]|uniref:glycine cleavage system protein GcvH n=1 Tax=Alicyclobacillus contaminans TaxID=392016 RepID=UPI00042631D4|nr:glycine cleavage system protein GcvH [Alicyclobacillus contaminans]
MAIPDDRRYHREHTWAKVDGDTARIGITAFAQEQLGEIIFVDLPKAGERITKDTPFGTVESAKTVSDLYAPLSGTVSLVNERLNDELEAINESPYEDGWMIVVTLDDPNEAASLLSADEYEQEIADA